MSGRARWRSLRKSFPLTDSPTLQDKHHRQPNKSASLPLLSSHENRTSLALLLALGLLVVFICGIRSSGLIAGVAGFAVVVDFDCAARGGGSLGGYVFVFIVGDTTVLETVRGIETICHACSARR